MRAALGLPSVDELSASLYVDQQQRYGAQQRDLQYRHAHALYQDQIDHQLQELQLRAHAAAELEHLPRDLQQHYAGFLLQERLARNAEEQAAAAQHQQHNAAFLAYRQAIAAHDQQFGARHGLAAQAAAARLRYQEELRHSQHAAALRAHLHAGVAGLDHLVLRNSGNALAVPHEPSIAAPAENEVASLESDSVEKKQAQDDTVVSDAVNASDTDRNISRSSSVDSVELEDMVIEQHKKLRPDLLPLVASGRSSKNDNSRRRRQKNEGKQAQQAEAVLSREKEHGQSPTKPTRKRGRPKKLHGEDLGNKVPKKKERAVDEEEEQMRTEAILQAMKERAAGIRHEVQEDEAKLCSSRPRNFFQEISPKPSLDNGKQENLNTSRSALVSKRAGSPTLLFGTIGSLLDAANSENKVFDAVDLLCSMKKGVGWPISEEEDNDTPKKTPNFLSERMEDPAVLETPCQSIVTSMLESYFPMLPQEPIDESEEGGVFATFDDSSQKGLDLEQQKGHIADVSQVDGGKKKGAGKKSKAGQLKANNVLDYPYPVDTWWPTITSRKRERRQLGYESDEDNFDEEEVPNNNKGRPKFRANLRSIRDKLEKEVEPGILEKIPHCKLHRLKRKNSALAELVYCFQVTEVYPNEAMVHCGTCGTWRHACCGGHFESFSVRKNIDKPFVAECEQCHQEKAIIDQYPIAKKRIERQRMEQMRRVLATTAVMRSMSFSKHGGTYKWPLGSVSATHVGGHTRSVQARHDKAEKQWADLISRLARGQGCRMKERQRMRTKELERLLVAIEDAEGQTDRHNMLLFLMRDTKKSMPVGFEEEKKNLFDPCYADDEFDSLGYTSIARRSEKQASLSKDLKDDAKQRTSCARPDCSKSARFDSKFCCDGCGVHVLEVDLLRAFHESNDIHPSVLRSHY